MASRVRPICDRIVVKRDSQETMTSGGIALPEQAQEEKRTGTVVEVGPGYYTQKGKLVPNSLKVGDRVLFGSYAGSEIEIDGEIYQIMCESHVAGVIVGDGNVETLKKQNRFKARSGDATPFYRGR